MHHMTCPKPLYISHLSIDCGYGTDHKEGPGSVTLRAVVLSDGAFGYRVARHDPTRVLSVRSNSAWPDRRCRLGSTSASYSGGPGFIYESEDQLF